jgi:hypothetical protein
LLAPLGAAPSAQAQPPVSGHVSSQFFHNPDVRLTSSPEEKALVVLLTSENPKAQLAGLQLLIADQRLNELQKVSILRHVLPVLGKPSPNAQQPLPPQVGRPQPMEGMMGGGMEEARSFIATAAAKALASLKTDSHRWALLRSEGLRDNLLHQIQPEALDEVLAAFSADTLKQPEFQSQLGQWVNSLASNPQAGLRGTASAVATAVSGNAAIFKDTLSQQDLLERLAQDRDERVQLITRFRTASLLRQAQLPEAVETRLLSLVQLPPASEHDQRNVLYSLEALSGLQQDETKASKLNEILTQKGVVVNSQTVEATVTVLNSFASTSEELRNQVISQLLQSPVGSLKALGALSVLHFPVHPEYRPTLLKLSTTKNSAMARRLEHHLPAIADIALRKQVVQSLVAHRREELAPLMKTVHDTEDRHTQLEDLIQAAPTEAERTKLEAELQQVMTHQMDATSTIESIGEVSIIAAKALSSFGPEHAAFQTEIIENLLQHPNGRTRLFAAKEIANVPSDKDKARLIRSATDIQGNAQFYIAFPEAPQGELPFVPMSGQTPFETIAASAAKALSTVEDDTTKIGLMNQLVDHPVQGVRYNVLQALPTLKTGHEQVQDAALKIARDPFRAMDALFPDFMQTYPPQALLKLVQEGMKADLDKPEDNDATRGWQSRKRTASLIRFLPEEYHAEKLALMKAGASDRLPIIRYLTGQNGVPFQRAEDQAELLTHYAGLKDPYFVQLAMLHTPGSKLAPEQKQALITQGIAHPDLGVQALAAQSIHLLNHQNAGVQQTLKTLCENAPPQIRQNLATGLARSQNSQLRQDLLSKLATDPSSEIRASVASALSQQPALDETLLPLVETLSQDKETAVRVSLAPAVGKLSNRTEADRLLKQLVEEQPNDVQAQIAWRFLNPNEPTQ